MPSLLFTTRLHNVSALYVIGATLFFKKKKIFLGGSGSFGLDLVRYRMLSNVGKFIYIFFFLYSHLLFLYF